MKLGDGVKRVTDALGIPQCGGCAKRQEWLNELGANISKLFTANPQCRCGHELSDHDSFLGMGNCAQCQCEGWEESNGSSMSRERMLESNPSQDVDVSPALEVRAEERSNTGVETLSARPGDR
jgi:hypothetical protein